MTDEVKRLRELEAQATPGPWFDDYGKVGCIPEDRSIGELDFETDSALAVAARNALPALLDIAEFVKAIASIADEGVTAPALRQMAKDALARLER